MSPEMSLGVPAGIQGGTDLQFLWSGGLKDLRASWMLLATLGRQQIQALCHSSVWGQNTGKKWPEFHPERHLFPQETCHQRSPSQCPSLSAHKRREFLLLNNLLLSDLPTPTAGALTQRADTFPHKTLLHLSPIPAFHTQAQARVVTDVPFAGTSC